MCGYMVYRFRNNCTRTGMARVTRNVARYPNQQTGVLLPYLKESAGPRDYQSGWILIIFIKV